MKRFFVPLRQIFKESIRPLPVAKSPFSFDYDEKIGFTVDEEVTNKIPRFTLDAERTAHHILATPWGSASVQCTLLSTTDLSQELLIQLKEPYLETVARHLRYAEARRDALSDDSDPTITLVEGGLDRYNLRRTCSLPSEPSLDEAMSPEEISEQIVLKWSHLLEQAKINQNAIHEYKTLARLYDRVYYVHIQLLARKSVTLPNIEKVGKEILNWYDNEAQILEVVPMEDYFYVIVQCLPRWLSSSQTSLFMSSFQGAQMLLKWYDKALVMTLTEMDAQAVAVALNGWRWSDYVLIADVFDGRQLKERKVLETVLRIPQVKTFKKQLRDKEPVH